LIDEVELKKICDKYKIKHKYFPQTNIVLLDSDLDEWQVRYNKHKDKPFCLLHKNKYRQKSKFHIQRRLRTLQQTIHCVASHKNVLIKIYRNSITNY
jgi:hypothetical protein